ncbi:cytochrome P450, partial [Schizophyllum commune]
MAAMLKHDATLLCEFGLAVLVVCLLVRIVRRKQSLPLPPGPPGIPFVGNILLMSPNKGWVDFEHWSKTYDSDLISLTGLGQQIIVANTYASSKAVLDRLNLSDRPHSVSMGELAGWNRATVLHYYDDVWKLQRRYLHQVLGTRAGLRKYDDLREGAAARFVKGLIDSPGSLEEQCHIYTTDLMLRIAFGYKTIGHDPMIQMAERALESSSEFTTPGTWLADVLPILRYIPSWNPFSKLHSAVETEKRNIHTLFDVPFDWVKREIVSTSGKPPQSFTGELLSQPDMTPEGELEVKWTAGTFLAAGSHTTTWTMFAFFKLMAAHPDIQRRAQAEIDSVLGAERLPVIGDMDRLPYTYTCCLETMRYHVVAPFGEWG